MRLMIPALILCSTAAHADVTVAFVEGAPKDRFVIENAGQCATAPSIFEIDLTASTAGLIFDTTEAGAGVEVFQPVEVVAGADMVIDLAQPGDGDQTLSVSLKSLPPGGEIIITLDLDDMIASGTSRPTMVTGSEIKGIAVRLTQQTDATAMANFTDSVQVSIPVAGCLS